MKTNHTEKPPEVRPHNFKSPDSTPPDERPKYRNDKPEGRPKKTAGTKTESTAQN